MNKMNIVPPFPIFKQKRSLSNVCMRRAQMALPPQPKSAPTTVLRRRRHIADQVYVTSTSIHCINCCDSNHYKPPTSKSDQSVKKKYLLYEGNQLKNICYYENQTIELQEVTLFLDTSLDHHYYESLNSDDDFDSFDSGSDADDDSFTKINQNDSGVDMGNSQLPEVPGNIYGLTRLAASAGKHMKRLRRNWSLTKNDITKSLSRMTKKKSTTNLTTTIIPPPASADQNTTAEVVRPPPPPPLPAPVLDLSRTTNSSNANASFSRKKNWLKFRRCVSMTSPNESSAQSDDVRRWGGIGTKSTFYLTSEIDVDSEQMIASSHQQEEEPVVPRRRRVKSSVGGVRPQSPPPPAPFKRAENIRSSSWYTECGLFKATPQPPSLITTTTTTTTTSTSNTCWYAEVGLYEKSEGGASSVEDSTNTAATELYYNMKNNEESVENSIYYNDHDDDDENHIKTTNYKDEQQEMQFMLKDEPLYQFYDAAVAENACLDQSSDSDYDGYEEIGDLLKSPIPKCQSSSIRSRFSSRTLWCEIPEVIQSEILSTLTVVQKKVQEAKFEVLTSEASYLNSLTVLEEHFLAQLNDELLLSLTTDRQVLFGLVPQMKHCSEMLLTDLELCWMDGIMLRGVCEAVLKHATQQGHVYVAYCENQVNLEVILRKCKENNKVFADQVQQLESNPRCQGLSLYSFLMLPMQRITRMPLLVDAILRRLTPDDDEFQVCQTALFKLNEVVRRCNEGARNVERQSELKRIAKQLLWPAHIPPIFLCNDSNNRWLVRSGQLIHLVARTDEVKLTFGKKFTKIPLTFFLFEDVLIITKKYSEETFTVIHHCPRNLIELSLTSAGDCLSQNRNLLFLTLLENHEARTIELMLSCASETDRQRWIEALSPPRSDNPYETVYESWDCPQVQAVHRYQATQPDELYLMKGDVVNVDKKMLDGWYHGERIRDGTSGWFPGNHTIEIANPHVRARNLKQRYRLLAFTDNYLNKSK